MIWVPGGLRGFYLYFINYWDYRWECIYFFFNKSVSFGNLRYEDIIDSLTPPLSALYVATVIMTLTETVHQYSAVEQLKLWRCSVLPLNFPCSDGSSYLHHKNTMSRERETINHPAELEHSGEWLPHASDSDVWWRSKPNSRCRHVLPPKPVVLWSTE